MKRKSTLFMIITLVALLAIPSAALAQYAIKQPWTSTIYYYNPAEESGELQVSYYNSLADAQAIPSSAIPVDAHQAGELYIGDTGVDQGFKGSAVLSASVPVLAVYEQAASGTDPNYNRLLYTAFETDQSAAKIFVPAFVIDPKSYKSQVGVQPIEGVDGKADIKVSFYNTSGIKVGELNRTGVNTGETFIVDEAAMRTDATLNTLLARPFNGSAVIEVVNGGSAVAAVEELQTNGRRGYAFEGISLDQVASKVFIPTGNCRYSSTVQTTYLAIQNAGDLPTKVKVTAYAENTTSLLKRGTYTAPTTIQPGAKLSINTCSVPGTAYRSSSLVIESLAGEELAVVGKVTGTGNGIATAFVGQVAPLASGDAARVVLPYVNWATNEYKGYRAFISVMNMNGTAAPAGDVKVTFYDRQAAPKTVSLGAIPAFSKRTFTPSSLKALKPDLSFKGAVEVKSTSGHDLLVIVRLQKRISGLSGYTYFAEDYLGVPYIAGE